MQTTVSPGTVYRTGSYVPGCVTRRSYGDPRVPIAVVNLWRLGYIRLFARHRVPARVAQESGFYAEHLSLRRVVELPPSRRETHNYLDLYWWKHSIYALLEVDVTRTRQFIEDHKAQTGEALSFTGYLAFCLARAVDEDKSVQAYLKGRKHLVVFDDVDVFLPVERELGGTPAAIPYIIRRANHKSFLEIHREIRDFQSQPVPPGRGGCPRRSGS